jgi:hypothetical protein
MRICALLLLLTALGPAASAQKQVDFSLGSAAALMFGHTTYDLELREGEPALLSKLEFPLDVLTAGIEARWDISGREKRRTVVTLSGLTNISAPRSLMADGDYDEYAGYPPWLWSYTESDVAMRSLFASAAVARSLFSADGLALFARAGYHFQYIYQEALNYSGWQVVWNDTTSEWLVYLVSYPDTALTYTIFYHLASLGALAEVRLAPRLHLEANAAFLAVLASDRDDHLLRTKLSTATGAGAGYLAGLALRYRFRDRDGSPYLGLSAELLGLRVRTSQTQKWYADTAGEPPAGTVYTGIPHIISSRQGRIVLELGRSF